MNLQIRDPRAHELARRLADKKRISMTDAVIEALESQLKREEGLRPLSERLAEIADEFASKVKPGGLSMTKEEIDEMWGH